MSSPNSEGYLTVLIFLDFCDIYFYNSHIILYFLKLVGGIIVINKTDLVKEWYKPGEIAKILGVTPRTILRYKDSGELIMKLDEEHNRWYMSKDDLISLLRKKDMLEEEKIISYPAVYARVSSHDQKKHGDLDRQIEYLQDYCKRNGQYDSIVFSDVASGLNTKRSGLNSLINAVTSNKVSVVYITYRDRLTRFGFEYLEKFFRHFGVEIIVVCTEEDKSVQEELVDDMMSLIASFSGRLYGLRSSSRRKIKNSIDNIPNLEE